MYLYVKIGCSNHWRKICADFACLEEANYISILLRESATFHSQNDRDHLLISCKKTQTSKQTTKTTD